MRGRMEIPTAYAAGYRAARAIDPEVAAAYIRHTTQADPPADRVVEDLATADPPVNVHSVIGAALNAPTNPPKNVPESLRDLVSDLCVVPDWYDPQVAQRASLAFIRNSNIVPAALAGAAIVEGFSTLISKSFRVRGRVTDNGIRRLRQNLLHSRRPVPSRRHGTGGRRLEADASDSTRARAVPAAHHTV